jgi:hypothetical protein
MPARETTDGQVKGQIKDAGIAYRRRIGSGASVCTYRKHGEHMFEDKLDGLHNYFNLAFYIATDSCSELMAAT